MKLCMLSLIVPDAIEDTIIDWLLEQDEIDGFNSLSLFGHGSHESVMSFSERVTGKASKKMFQSHVTEQQANDILARLKKDFANADIHYMIRPLIDAGNLSNYETK
ncbi:MAG: DUF3240 family protein [Alphaproteobacteria bacterium]|nr:DUF3240 family protein [Alphaproteobacteria bacterium]HPF47533.1 DUF3240 family protein [Emcibacteraceae bacterium]HRW28851.1 DUF3240 family protein [Emcibacteraceae bacterium]